METADPLLQEMLSLLLRCDLSTSTPLLFAAWTIFHHICFCHDRTTITSERSENIGEHDFRSAVLDPIFSIATPFVWPELDPRPSHLPPLVDGIVLKADNLIKSDQF